MGTTDDVIRRRERIDTLLEVVQMIDVKAGAPDVDPYLWGYGTNVIKDEVKRMLAETAAT